MREIADAANVHFTTVSRALRNHPALPQETRERIRQLAQQMGYTPDPALCALNSYRLAQRRIVSYQGTIAWLDGFPNPHSTRKIASIDRIFQGAEQRAQQLGYKLERFWLGTKSTQEMRQLERQLKARGVRNLIISSQFHGDTELELSWERYSAVSVSLSFVNQSICTIVNDHYGNAVLLMRKLRSLGYRRIGMLLDERLLAITRRRWLSGYLLEREYELPENQVETLHFKDDAGLSDSALKRWYRSNRPDAVITDWSFAQKRLLPLLRLRAPEQIGIATLSVSSTHTHAGIEENSYGVGLAAAQQLVRMDQSSERGPSETPLRIYIRGQWKHGSSVRADGAPAAPTAPAAQASTAKKR